MKRYPGIRPFRTDEQAIFYGRDLDIDRLHRLIELEQLVILYGKSGYGKSSLLSAGIFPRLKAAGKRQFWEIRFGPYKAGESRPPAEYVRQAITRNSAAQPLVPDALADACIWQAFKNRQQGENAAFLLVFDQFEELFSYPQEQILAFKKQLAEALYSKVPKRFEAALADAGLSPEQEDAVYTPFELKVVFSIRSDRMSQLNVLKDYLPNLLQNGYELDALDEAGARDAILRPAGLNPTPIPSPKGEGGLPSNKKLISEGMETSLVEEEENQASDNISNSGAMKPPSPLGEGLGVGLTTDEAFDTPPFTYSSDALNAIFTALSDDRGRIETSTLQIICRYVEDNLVGTEGADIRIEADDLGNIKAIFRQFYERTIARLPEAEQIPARRLVEDRLIKDGVRIPYAAQALLAEPDITQELLDALSAASLLRVQRDEQGRMLYEVGHDTLVAPITEAAQARRAEEEKLRLQREADEQRREKEEAVAARRRARMVAIGAIVLSLIAIAASFWAWRQTLNAQEQTRIAKEKTILAEQNQKKADDKTLEAQENLKTAKENARLAEEKRLEVEQQKNATAEQKRKAEEEARRTREALREVEITTVKVVQGLFRDASAAILRLDYETARDRLHDAADFTAKMPFDNPLGRLRPAVADSLLEPAYFLAESGNAPGAMFEIGMIAQALAAHDPADTLQIDTSTPEGARRARAALRRILQNLRPTAFQAMEEKYYPVLLPVPGGTFNLTENYQVTLSDYRLARTETTVWQYNLYLAEQGKDIFDDKVIPKPGWGWEGDNPIVNVSWFDACLYANWLSKRFGLHPVYEKGAVSEDIYFVYYENIVTDTAANGFRLPTEAEWKFAARGGIQGLRDSFEYAGGPNMNTLGWYNENSGNRARAVAAWQPNQLGLYDMSGNVWEWCYDGYGDFEDTGAPQVNPVGPKEGASRVYRGGSWNDAAGYCRVSRRYGLNLGNRISILGFRLASSP